MPKFHQYKEVRFRPLTESELRHRRSKFGTFVVEGFCTGGFQGPRWVEINVHLTEAEAAKEKERIARKLAKLAEAGTANGLVLPQ